MALPTPNLDDLRFQKDLVDKVRRQIATYCPEWTDYNLSDPGITLIEMFAWMTEQVVYRLNRVPDKNYIKFLELLGVQLQPASSAHVPLTFRLSIPFPIGPEDDTVAAVPAGAEVATREGEGQPEVIFTTDQALTIGAPKLSQLRREGEFHKNYLPRLGVETFAVFDDTEPKQGDTFYLGFDESQPINGYILRLAFTCEPIQAVGIRREDPPLVWECSLGEGQWQELVPSARHSEKDTTGGLNNLEGELVLYLPLDMQPDAVNGRSGYWLRCRFEQRRPEQGLYSESPRVTGVTGYTLGATTWATHAVLIEDEQLGLSNGEPGQVFHLTHAPVLSLRAGEAVEVEEERYGEPVFVPWQHVANFANSDRYDRHFTLDEATGQIHFGPAIRQRDGTVRQYGRVPEPGREIRIGRYRSGGGVSGNVPAGQIQVLKSAIPYIDSVTNLRPAVGGQDQEDLEEAKFRSVRELRTQARAVTAEDYEHLTRAASRGVARVKCTVPQRHNGHKPSGLVEVLVIPAVADSLRNGDLSSLHLTKPLAQTIEAYLDQYRLLSTALYVREPDYLGVQVEAEIVPSEYSLPDQVVASVEACLNRFLCPLALVDEREAQAGLLEPDWAGWPFGQSLYVAEIFSLIQRVPGVKHVLDVKLSTREVKPADETPPGDPEAGPVSAKEVSPIEGKILRLKPDMVLCSLNHKVTVADLGGQG